MKKYFTYSIGEIFLVVVGILLALQINTWNQNRLDSNEEERLLQVISEKMRLNHFQYEFGYERHKEVIAAAEQLLMVRIDTSAVSNLQIDQNIHALTKRFIMGKSNKTSIYDELIAAGQIGLITSDELRSNLTALKANLQLLESYEILQNNFVDGYLSPFLNKNIDRTIVAAHGSEKDSTFYDKQIGFNNSIFTKRDTSNYYPELLKNREFSNLLIELIQQTKKLLPIYERIGANIFVIDSIATDGNPSLYEDPSKEPMLLNSN